jgi:hypothetical protein
VTQIHTVTNCHKGPSPLLLCLDALQAKTSASDSDCLEAAVVKEPARKSPAYQGEILLFNELKVEGDAHAIH